MSALVNVLVAVAVIVFVVTRQFRAQQIAADRRWWLVPVVLLILAVRQGGLVDAHHQDASVALLAGEAVVGIVTGVAWALTSRVWTEADGTKWTRGTKSTVGAWILGIVLRLGLAGLGALLGIHQGTGALLLGLALSLLVRSLVVMWRAGALGALVPAAAAYGERVPLAPRKDR